MVSYKFLLLFFCIFIDDRFILVLSYYILFRMTLQLLSSERNEHYAISGAFTMIFNNSYFYLCAKLWKQHCILSSHYTVMCMRGRICDHSLGLWDVRHPGDNQCLVTGCICLWAVQWNCPEEIKLPSITPQGSRPPEWEPTPCRHVSLANPQKSNHFLVGI